MMIYFPFTNNRFGCLYGLDTPDTLFYFMYPYYVATRLNKMSIQKRGVFVVGGAGLYHLIKQKINRKSEDYVNMICS